MEKPNTGKALDSLKDFQRNTVDYVFKRLYGDDPADRFLVADEVGLGKTMIAKGVVAKAIDHLWSKPNHRIDIVYICANRDIAAQNIKRLNLTGQEKVASTSRLTLLPIEYESLNSRLNFISFTPGTSFELKSRTGVVRERALIYRILRDNWGFGTAAAPRNLLQGDISLDSWKWWIKAIDSYEINIEIIEKFINLLEEKSYRADFELLASKFSRYKENIPPEDRRERNNLISIFRSLLAQACVSSLEPDIVILDEFQRFKNLLENSAGDENSVAQLAQTLFNYPGAKVLLLSATPYKMYTMGHETEDDHYRDFLHTIDFLFNHDKEKMIAFGQELENYRKAIYELGPNGMDRLRSGKERIEKTLRKVIVRTERLSTTIDRNGMVENAKLQDCKLNGDDLRAFALTDTLAQECGISDTVEYWKSAPYLLNFMGKDEYVFKQKVLELAKDGKLRAKALKRIEDSKDLMLALQNSIESYKKIDPLNAKLRALMANTVDRNAWELLWLPPSLPYYAAEGPIERNNLQEFTKALIFSSWRVVPKVIATLCSYEAERRIMEFGGNTDGYDAKRTRLIAFNVSGEELRGMNFFTLLYPSYTLATMIDPLKISIELTSDGKIPASSDVIQAIRIRVAELLEPVFSSLPDRANLVREEGKSTGDSWNTAMLALLDRHYYQQQVASWRNLEEKREDEEALQAYPWAGMADQGEVEEKESRFDEHVKRLWNYFDNPAALPKSQLDREKIVDTLTKVALGSPAVLSLRALLRLGNSHEQISSASQLISEASRIAWAFRALFNQPDSIMVIRGQKTEGQEESYWEKVLDYCISGNLQSVLDEYVHVLRESIGVSGHELGEAARSIANEISSTVSIQTVSLSFDKINFNDKKIRFDQGRRIRCRFALRYGDEAGDKDNGENETRADQVRKAFNSPFRPFILASTSVGQEGIDFHHYCHSIYHWNLPSNPVDFEQREGRVHRYKGHVIRKNVAGRISIESLRDLYNSLCDPWDILFGIAKRNRGTEHNDIVPYWVYEHTHKIKRYVPTLPLSREQEQFERLKKSIAAYRMVFGQPRQEDLLEFLQKSLDEGVTNEDILMCRIDLCPSES